MYALKKTGKIALCAMLAALASVFMLISYFPYLTYAIPAVSGLFIMIVVIETDIKWATLTYLSSAVIVALIGEPEAKMLYILFFGYYPILKAIFERLKNRPLEYLLKFLSFNAAIIVAYTFVAALLGVSLGEMGDFGKYTAAITLLAANIVFPIYDAAVSRMAQFYLLRLHSQIAKIFKGK